MGRNLQTVDRRKKNARMFWKAKKTWGPPIRGGWLAVQSTKKVSEEGKGGE